MATNELRNMAQPDNTSSDNSENVKELIDFKEYAISDLGNVYSLKYNKKKKLKFSIDGSGYCQVKLYSKGVGKSIKIHQLVAIAFLNHKICGHEIVVDHINHNKKDNRLCNLRLLTNRENSSHRKNNKYSKFTGVTYCKSRKKWKSQITINYKNYNLGYFNKEILAHKAYQKKLLNL